MMHALQIGSCGLTPTSWTDPRSLYLDQMAHYNNFGDVTFTSINREHNTPSLGNLFPLLAHEQCSLERHDRVPEVQENQGHDEPSSSSAIAPSWQTPTQLEATANFHLDSDNLQHNVSLLENFPRNTDVDPLTKVTVSLQGQLSYPEGHVEDLQDTRESLHAPNKRPAGPVSQNMEPLPKRQRAVNVCYFLAHSSCTNVMQACDRCRRRRQKCSEQLPCNLCEKDGALCHYREMPQTRFVVAAGTRLFKDSNEGPPEQNLGSVI